VISNANNVDADTTRRACHQHIDLDIPTPVKYLARVNGLFLLKWKIGKFLCGFKRVKGAQNKMKSVRNICECDQTSLITTKHLELCPKHSNTREEVQAITGLSFQELIN
jgi:hypothetical protein